MVQTEVIYILNGHVIQTSVISILLLSRKIFIIKKKKGEKSGCNQNLFKKKKKKKRKGTLSEPLKTEAGKEKIFKFYAWGRFNSCISYPKRVSCGSCHFFSPPSSLFFVTLQLFLYAILLTPASCRFFSCRCNSFQKSPY